MDKVTLPHRNRKTVKRYYVYDDVTSFYTLPHFTALKISTSIVKYLLNRVLSYILSFVSNRLIYYKSKTNILFKILCIYINWCYCSEQSSDNDLTDFNHTVFKNKVILSR